MNATEYRKLVVIVWLVVIASMAAIWGGNAWRGASWDTDDFMRLVQVRDWLGGQGWSDLTQYRLNPPDGTPMHWSRLADLPLAAVTLALSPLLAVNDGLAVAAMMVPPLYFLLFLVLYALPARMMLGMARSPIALLVAISGSGTVAQYAPGRVDHHGLQLIMLMAAVALLLCGLARRRWRRLIALAGIPIGLSLWIGAEMLPLIGAWFAALGLAWCWSGGALARQGALAAGLAAFIGLVLILVAMPRALWPVPACDALSVAPVGAVAFVAAGFAGMTLLDRWAGGRMARLLIAALCGAVVAAAYVLAFPECLGGGLFGALDPEVKLRWLDKVAEALTLGEQLRLRPFGALDKLWTPLLALAYCLWRIRRGATRSRQLWGALALLLAAATALIFWQVRAASAAHVLALLPLAALIAEVWQRLKGRGTPRWRQFLVLLPILFVCSAVFWPALEYGTRFAAAALAPTRPAPMLVRAECSDRAAIAPLAAAAPTTILSYIDLGPMLLFSTPHAVLGAPYHRNNGGLKDTIALFRAADDAWIRDRLQARGIGWVAICPGPENFVTYATETGDGLAERLVAGKVPDYLAEVPDPAHPGLRLYRVAP